MVTSSTVLAQGPWDCILVSAAIDRRRPAGTPGSWFLPITTTTPVFINIIIIIIYCYNRSRSIKSSQSLAKYHQEITSNTEKSIGKESHRF